MRRFIRKISFFILIGILIFISMFYYRLYFGDLYPEFKILRNSLATNADVILLGSSVNKSVAKYDTDRRSVSEILDNILTNKEVVGISHSAYQLDIFFDIINYIVKNKNSNYPTVIVPINLRSFAPQWNFRPTYQFTKEKYYLHELPYFDFIDYKGFKQTKECEFEEIPIFYDGTKVGIVKDFENREINIDSITYKKMGFISCYMQPIEYDNTKLNKLKEIDSIAKKNDIDILFYITPIDIEEGERLEIEKLREIVLKNIAIIKATVKYSKIVDLSFIMKTDKFDYGKRPNEHLNMYGRFELSKILAEEVNEIGNARTHNMR